VDCRKSADDKHTGEAMPNNGSKRGKVALAVVSGLLVGIMAATTHLLMMPLDRGTVLHSLVGDLIAALTAVIVCLAIQLQQEEVHYQTAIERAAIVAELNHHIRNAVFPLSLAIHKSGDAASIGTAQDAVERINIALQDATADALTGRTQYRRPSGPTDEHL
jgi:hypothetical protein